MLRPSTWPCPGSGEEYALGRDEGRKHRLLVLPALFDEANKLRHFTAATMRLLDAAGIDTFLPDLAGCNESPAPLADQSLNRWREQAEAAASHFRATHCLTVRAAAELTPAGFPVVHYAPATGPGIVRGLLRARVLSDREAGIESHRDQLLERGRAEGLTLSGYQLSGRMIAELADAKPRTMTATTIPQSALGGGALWLRSEPAHDPEQAAKLAELVAGHLQ